MNNYMHVRLHVKILLT